MPRKNSMSKSVKVEIGGFKVRVNQNGLVCGAASTLIMLAAKGLIRRESQDEFYAPPDVLARAYGLVSP